MDWVKLTTNYYLDAAVMRAGEAAEVLFTRALAYVGDQESDGVVPREALDRLTPTRGTTRAAALVREGLWEVVEGVGWRFTTWDRHQKSREAMAERRESGRRRQATHRTRARNGVTNATGSAVSDGHVTPREVEEEVDAAAAAPAAAAALPGPVDLLRSRLQAHTPLRGLRFDTLRPDQLDTLEVLIELHGDHALADAALSTCRNPAPVHAAAFLGTWAALPEPGQRLRLIRQELCPTHDTVRSPAGICNGCVSDKRAAR